MQKINIEKDFLPKEKVDTKEKYKKVKSVVFDNAFKFANNKIEELRKKQFLIESYYIKAGAVIRPSFEVQIEARKED